MIPSHYTPARKRIIQEYLEVKGQYAGSRLYREIAAKLHYKIDQNGTSNWIKEVVETYEQN